MINWFVATKFHVKPQFFSNANKSWFTVLQIPFVFFFHSFCMNGGILQVLFHEDGSVKGIATNDVGIHKDGSPKVDNFRCEICACILQTEKFVTKEDIQIFL